MYICWRFLYSKVVKNITTFKSSNWYNPHKEKKNKFYK